jgi:hypothetical protein
LEYEFAALTVQADGLIAKLAHQEDGLARRLVECQGQLVLGPGFFHGLAHLALYPKKAVSWHGVVDALVGAEVIVVVDEMRETFLGIEQFQWLDAGPEFFPHRAPEAFTFAQGLGMVSP